MLTFRLPLAFTLVSMSALVAHAEDAAIVEVLPCRPTIACTAEIVPGGSLEVETGFAQRRATGTALSSVMALAKYSITDHVQVQVGTNNIVASQDGTASNLDGVYVGPKVVLADATSSTPSVAVSALVMTPTRNGTSALTQTRDAYLWVYASKDTVFDVHADFNVGINVLSYDAAPAVQEVVALSLSRDIGRGVGAMLEGYGYWHGGAYASHDAGVLTGLTYSVTPRMMFDAGFDVALYRDSRDLTMFAGVTFVPYTTAITAPAHAASVAVRD